MTTELDILFDLHSYMSTHIDFMRTMAQKGIKIKQNIENLDNSYFTDKLNNPNIMSLLEHDHEEIEIVINKLIERRNIIKSCILQNCDHDWVTDYIDIGPDESQQICYCSKCEITQK